MYSPFCSKLRPELANVLLIFCTCICMHVSWLVLYVVVICICIREAPLTGLLHRPFHLDGLINNNDCMYICVHVCTYVSIGLTQTLS